MRIPLNRTPERRPQMKLQRQNKPPQSKPPQSKPPNRQTLSLPHNRDYPNTVNTSKPGRIIGIKWGVSMLTNLHLQ